MSSLSVENITHMNEEININYIFYTLDQQNSTNIEYTIPETYIYIWNSSRSKSYGKIMNCFHLLVY